MSKYGLYAHNVRAFIHEHPGLYLNQTLWSTNNQTLAVNYQETIQETIISES